MLTDLAERATESEWDFIRRVVLGELRTGALEGVLLDAIARAAGRPAEAVRRAAMLSGDLGETALLALTGTADELEAVGLVVGRGVMPMLASTAATAAEAIATVGEASVEYKLDGARIQVHRRGDEVRIFTRSLADVTDRLPEVVEVVRAMPVTDVILDGETLALDENDAPRPFQDTMARFGAQSARETILHPWFFDVLHVDGRDLIDEPLRVRRDELGRIAPAHRIPGEVTSDPAVAERVSARCARRRAGGRRDQGDRLAVRGRTPRGELDQGQARAHVRPRRARRGVGLRPPQRAGCRTCTSAHSTRRASSAAGGSWSARPSRASPTRSSRWQTERFQELAVRETPGTVWLPPEIVVEIAIDGVQRSTRYPGGLALRFARVKRYRDDKRPAEADTIQTLRGMLRG